MAAPGTIVLAVADPSLKRGHPNHQFTSLGGQFHSHLCVTPVPFTIHPNEGHVLLTDLDQILGATIKTGDILGPISHRGKPLQLGYMVRLTLPDMMLHVGQDTSLSLLLRAGCLTVAAVVVTKEQLTQMIPPPPPPPVQQSFQPVEVEEDDDRLIIADM